MITRYRERMSTPTIEWFMSRVRVRPDGCWEFKSVTGVRLKHRPVIKIAGKQRYLSRWVFETFKREKLGAQLACHTCDRGWCVNPDHLFKGTYKDNVEDCIRKGRRIYMTSEQARRISAMRKEPWNLGVPMNKETRKKVSAANLGRKRTAEQRANYSIAAIRREKRFKRLGLKRRVSDKGMFIGGFQ